MPSPQAKVLLADDHNMIRSGLRMLLQNAEFDVVGEAPDGRIAVELVKKLEPDVLVIDLRMPNLNGLEATRQAILLNPNLKVICISADTDDRSATEAIRAGAKAYVAKDAAFEELIAAIKSVLQDKVYLSPSVALAMHQLQHTGDVTTAISKLSPREREVLQLLAEGRATKEIAHDLSCSVKTAETHRRNLMIKLNIDSIAELTKYAIREGVTSI